MLHTMENPMVSTCFNHFPANIPSNIMEPWKFMAFPDVFPWVPLGSKAQGSTVIPGSTQLCLDQVALHSFLDATEAAAQWHVACGLLRDLPCWRRAISWRCWTNMPWGNPHGFPQKMEVTMTYPINPNKSQRKVEKWGNIWGYLPSYHQSHMLRW